jgi:hypothetical protein
MFWARVGHLRRYYTLMLFACFKRVQHLGTWLGYGFRRVHSSTKHKVCETNSKLLFYKYDCLLFLLHIFI